MKRWNSASPAIGLAATVLVGLLDLLTPPEMDFGELYLIPVVVASWTHGWRTGAFFGALVTIVEIVADSSLLRATGESHSWGVESWNALSTFLAFVALAYATDRVHQERDRWRSVTNDHARLLRLLEREFPRPLRAIEWFARTFEEAVAPDSPLPSKLRGQFNALRHHTQEVSFLATDVIRIGKLDGGEFVFNLGSVDLKVIAREAADHSLDRNRVLVRTVTEPLIVRADEEALRHSISAVIGRLLEKTPSDLVELFLRGSAQEAVVEFTARGEAPNADELQLPELLVRAIGGRLVVTPRGSQFPVRVNLYVPRTEQLAEPMARSDVSVRESG